MLIKRVTLLPPDGTGDRAPVTPTDVILRSVTRSRQVVVLEMPTGSLEETPLATSAGAEAGYGIVLTTAAERTYSGYVEVVAEGTGSRFYWCGLDL